MFYFIVIGLIALLFLGSLAGLLFSEDKFGPAAATAGFAVLGLIVTFFFSITTVDSRAVGIQTSFGRYQDTVDNGLHLVAPWSSVEEFSTLKQDLDLKVPVSFEGGSSGTVKLTALWAVESKDAEKLWKDWRTFDRVRDRLVAPAARTQVAAAFSGYTPDAAKDGNNRVTIQDEIDKTLDALRASGVDVTSIQITDVELGDRAQAAVDRIVEATANTQRATEEQNRAKIEAETAKIRQESQTAEALQRYCLEVVNNWDASKNGNLPATFNCVLSGAGQTPIIVGQ